MLNKAILIGNVGAEPEIKTLNNGGKVANISLATSESWKDKNTGERKEKTEWHRVVVFNDALCNVIEQYVKKGDRLYIEGQIQTRKWQDNTGADRYSTEIVLQGFGGVLKMLSSKSDAGPSQHESAKQDGYAPQPADLDDEIPF